MKNIFIISLLLIIGCSETKKEEIKINNLPKESVVENNSKDTAEAKTWLVKSIESYFNADISNQENIMQNITTKDYYEFKTDATNVDLDVDGSLTLKEFQQKWKNKFNTENVALNTGFLISAQDWTKIEVKKCDLNASLENDYSFYVELQDIESKEVFKRIIKVTKIKNKFFIGNVLEKVN
ncbi:hypothetical protein [Chryseobacterium balustinum]|uniref:DUF3828 domain-containing protein n=1 Tax=Chryseobacterium balustinum TaxID=246 RepID=A0AAX2IP82_9FLAO|nr:hypothetical protein [Chryseobacterium balustinum]AZB30047.1 hypothetical protein EB354_12730 [Chryseobacterium balustinum]SKB66766.1 hypothetical protein SAMN05421800_105194 [Chryseobacterium balustinum]SQA91745.1 Uncharacterised protein [Chryseobacterium balustinum]